MSTTKRCDWCLGNELYMEYHDKEWGAPVHNDRIHFEFMVLESAQAGLSWLTILKRRENYRKLYAGFKPEKVARFDEDRIAKMLADPGIIRNRKKIESSITNARYFLEIVIKYGSFDKYIWGFTDGKVIKNQWRSINEIPATSSLSDKLAKDMRSRGFRFLGSTILYSHLQSVGIINDHLIDCFRYKQV